VTTRAAITSLAILKVNWDTLKRDYIENFVPLVVECVRSAPDDVVALPQVQEALRSQFGLALPLNPLRQVLQRAAKQGYLTRSQGIFTRDAARCASLNFGEVQQRVSRIHDNVVNALKEFAAHEHKTAWSTDETEAALLAFIAENGLAFLYAEAERTPLVLDKAPSGAPFIVGSFLSQIRERDVRLLEDVEVLIKGNILANSLFLPDQGRLQQRFQKTRVYLDTSIIIFAAGYAGKDRQAPCSELLELLREYGAELYCFPGTYDEVRGILDACTARLKYGQLRTAYGPTIEYFIQEGYRASDVELMAARLPQKLSSLGIRIDSKPPYEHQFQIDEAALERHLQREIGYHNEKARLHDVDCVSAIARLRRGQDSYAVETCRAVFVTTNFALVRTTRSFFQADSSPGATALCITDYALGNLLWLKNPTSAPDLPRKRLIADAYAAMQPPDSLWKLYLAEIARLEDTNNVSADDYYLLRHSTAAKAALMEITRGDASAFAEGTVAEVLAIAREHLRADLQQDLEAEKHRRHETELRLGALQDDQALTVNRVGTVSAAVARWTSRLLFLGTMVVLGGAVVYTFPWSLPDPKESWLRYARTMAIGALFIYTLASMAWGTTVSGFASRFEDALCRWLERTLLRFLGIQRSAPEALPQAAEVPTRPNDDQEGAG
jgi:hypothetical protein